MSHQPLRMHSAHLQEGKREVQLYADIVFPCLPYFVQPRTYLLHRKAFGVLVTPFSTMRRWCPILHFTVLKTFITIILRVKITFVGPSSCCSCGQNSFIYRAANDWDILSNDQRAKKVVCDSPGLVDFAIGLVNSVLNLPDGQVKIFCRSKITKVL